jgi:hypothetical protein
MTDETQHDNNETNESAPKREIMRPIEQEMK